MNSLGLHSEKGKGVQYWKFYGLAMDLPMVLLVLGFIEWIIENTKMWTPLGPEESVLIREVS